MLTDSQFPHFYMQAKVVLEKYRTKKEVNQFLVTHFAEIEKSQSLMALKETLSQFCKQLNLKVNSVGLTAFGGTCTTCGCLTKIKAITQEIASVIEPFNRPRQGRVRRNKV